jgi:hypothetical protein
MNQFLILTFLLVVPYTSSAQAWYSANMDRLEVGHTVSASQTVWSDSPITDLVEFTVYKDSLIKKTPKESVTYTFKKPKESNPGVHSFLAEEQLTGKSYEVTFFTSPCLDAVSFTVIIADEQVSYNYSGRLK